MKNLIARFTSDKSTLVVSAKSGKKGIAVLARAKAPDGTAKTGCRSVFLLTHEKEATAKFEELRNEAIAKGWAPKVKTARAVDAFAAIPTPAELTKPAPVVTNKRK